MGSLVSQESSYSPDTGGETQKTPKIYSSCENGTFTLIDVSHDTSRELNGTLSNTTLSTYSEHQVGLPERTNCKETEKQDIPYSNGVKTKLQYTSGKDSKAQTSDGKDGSSIAPATGLPAPPDGEWGWVILIASFFLNLIIDGICFSFGIAYLKFLDYYRDSKAKTAWVGSVLNGTYMLAGPLVAALMGLFGGRAVVIAGSILAATAFCLSTFSPNIEVFIVVYGAFGGFGFGLMYLPAVVLVGYYFDKRRALATGIAVSGSGFGALAMAPVTEVLMEEYGWKGATWITGGIILNGIISGALLRPVSEQKRNNTIDLESKKLRQTEKTKQAEANSMKEKRKSCGHLTMQSLDFSLLKNPVFTLLAISILFTMICFFIPITYVPDYAIGNGVSHADAAFLVSIIGISNTVGRVLCGWVADLPWADCLLIYNASLTIGGAATILLPFCKSFELLAVYSAIFGTAIAALISLLPIIMVELFGVELLTKSVGLVTMFRGIGTIVGSPVAGFLLDSSGNYDIPFYMAGGTMILAALLCFPLRRLEVWLNKKKPVTKE